MNTRRLVVLVTSSLIAVTARHAFPDPTPIHPRIPESPLTLSPAAQIAQPPSPATAALLGDDARRISFQALLTNDQGGPISQPNGQHELDFRIYASLAAVLPIGQILDVQVTLNQGIANTYIGPLDPDWFDGSARWLGVTVDNGAELSPRILLGAVPYAFRVNRVASAELDDIISLGGAAENGTLHIHSGIGQGRISMYGLGQLMETRNDAGELVALYGYDAFGGGGASLLGTSAQTTGLLLDGNHNSDGGGHIVLYDLDEVDAISLQASASLLRIGSPNPGAAGGDLHLYPSTGAPSRIHLDGQAADARFGVTGEASGDVRLFSSSGGLDRIHLSGSAGLVTLTDGTRDTLQLNSNAGDGGGAIVLWNSAGTQTVEVDADETDHGAFRLFNASGVGTFEVEAQESAGSPGAQLVLRNAAGSAAIVLDAELGVGGDGVMTTTGRLGIGTTNPNHELVVQGDDPAMQIRDDATDNSANAARLELLERAGGSFDGGAFFTWNGETNKLLMGTKLSGVNTNVLVIDRATDSVGIGTQEPGDYRLAVNGAIRAKEIVVETGWSDFVFEPDYDLATLPEVEAHIRAHGHLPDIPSAAEVEQNGVKVGEMESKLLRKIEELTLHMIAMDKRMKELEERNAQLVAQSCTPGARGGRVK